MSNERFAIIGAGHFGSSIATALSERGAEVLVIDSDIKVIQDLSEEVAYSILALLFVSVTVLKMFIIMNKI